MKIIDPHLHLFNLEQGDYHWLKANNPPFWPDKSLINNSFTEKDLKLQAPFSLAGFIHIEAGFDNQQPWQELNYLQQSCQLPFNAIASIDLSLDSNSFTQQLQEISLCDCFIGVRHILDEEAFSLLNNKQVLSNIALLDTLAATNKSNLVFEVQMPLDNSHAVNALADVINRNNKLTFIINHSGFPTTEVSSFNWKEWQENIAKLAAFKHVAIKCSGWEMNDRLYNKNLQWLNLILETCFNAFGEKRTMLASNFPLCLFTHYNYQDYWQQLLTTDFIKNISDQEKNALCYHNALRYYALKL